MEKIEKTAVVLFNLGGPDSPAAIRPFLYNFFMDPNIIRLPLPFRWFLAQLISRRRSRKEAAASYGLLGGRSPLLENTQAQARALEEGLGENFKTFVCMRYWHPMAAEVAAAVKSYAPDRIMLLPLYPQYSTTTTRSALQQWEREANRIGLDVPTRFRCCYSLDEGYVGASAKLVREVLDRAFRETGEEPRLLFSAHGLPESVIRGGDPYQRQCEAAAAAIAAAAGVQEQSWAICYQSRVGRMKWIGPSLEEELERAARDSVPVVICPHSFTQEHVETLVELDIEYRHKAEELGVPGYYRVPAVGTDPQFISGLARMVRGEERSDQRRAA